LEFLFFLIIVLYCLSAPYANSLALPDESAKFYVWTGEGENYSDEYLNTWKRNLKN